MNSYKDKLIIFFSYIKKYKYLNIFLSLLYLIGFLGLIYSIDFCLFILFFSIVCFPCFIVHLIEENIYNFKFTKQDFILNKKENLLKILNFIKSYILKYIKSFIILTFNFVISIVFIYISSIISIVLLANQQVTFLLYLLLLVVSTWFLFEGFDFLIMIIPMLSLVLLKNFSLFKSFSESKKLLKKQRFKYSFSVMAFSLLLLPVLILIDNIIDFAFINILFKIIYFLIVLNFTIFEWKMFLNKQNL